MAVLWDVAPSSGVQIGRPSEVLPASVMRVIALMLEAASTSETSINFYQTARPNNAEGIIILSTKRTSNLTSKHCNLST
jgi:hypothetical protein